MSLSHPPPTVTALMPWSQFPAFLDKPGMNPALQSLRGGFINALSMRQGEASSPLLPALEISQHRAKWEGSSTKGVEGIVQGVLEVCQYWEGLAVSQSTPRLWAGHTGSLEVTRCFQQQPQNLCKDVGSGPALDPTGVAAPLCICKALGRAAVMGKWAGSAPGTPR